MKPEIERKFLITAIQTNSLKNGVKIRQGYIGLNHTVRIRIEDNQRSFLTIKLGKAKTGRLEFEYEISIQDGEALLEERNGRLIEKTRYRIGQFEIDVFLGELFGLVMAEIELNSFHEKIKIPKEFLQLEEVTQNEMFENENLAQLDKLPKEWICEWI